MSEPDYCNACENFPCLGNHWPGEIEERDYWDWLMRYGARSRKEIKAYDMVLPRWPDPPPFSPMRDLIPHRDDPVRKRQAEETGRREWTEGVRRRLGLVAEVHRCWVYGDDQSTGWAWMCLRPDCDISKWGYSSQPKALAKALAHTSSFVPEPPEETPVTELELMIIGALYPGARLLPAGHGRLDLTGRGAQA